MAIKGETLGAFPKGTPQPYTALRPMNYRTPEQQRVVEAKKPFPILARVIDPKAKEHNGALVLVEVPT